MIYFYLEVKMQNQINMADQNTQQVGQNPVNQPVIEPEKPKINYWMVITILMFLLLVIVSLYALNLNKKFTSKNDQVISESPIITQQTAPTNITAVTETPIPAQQKPTYDLITYKSKDYEGLSYSIDIPKNWKVEDQMVYIPSAMSASDPTNKKIFIEISPTTTTDGPTDFTDASSQDAIKRSKRHQFADINGQKMLYTEYDDSAGYTIIAKNNRRYIVQIWGISTNPELITMLQGIIKTFKFLPQ